MFPSFPPIMKISSEVLQRTPKPLFDELRLISDFLKDFSSTLYSSQLDTRIPSLIIIY